MRTVFHSLAAFYLFSYDTMHLNYGSIGTEVGTNIVARREQMDMWVRDKGGHSPLMKTRVSDSL